MPQDETVSKDERIINVLILGVGGNVSQGILKALRKTSIAMKIYGACISEMSKGLYMCDESYICPLASDDEFIPWVISFCNKKKISIIFTGVEENIIELEKNRPVLNKDTKAIFISSSYEQICIGQDKFLTCKWLENNGCNYPKYELWRDKNSVIDFGRKVGFPVIVKPRKGKSATGIYIIHNENEADKYDDLTGYVMEEYLGSSDKEYTVGCYMNREKNDIRIIIMHRILKNGTTVWAKVVENNEIKEEALKICERYKPNGPLNIQMRVNGDNKPVCFELNVRFSGTTAMRANFGFEDVKALILEYVYNQSDIAECFKMINGEAFRYDEEFYLKSDTVERMKENCKLFDIKNYLLED